MSKEKSREKFGISGGIAVLMQIQMVLIGIALILTGNRVSRNFSLWTVSVPYGKRHFLQDCDLLLCRNGSIPLCTSFHERNR